MSAIAERLVDLLGRLSGGEAKGGRPKDERRRFVLEMLPPNAVGAEIGVWKGDFSDQLWTATAPKALHLIDPWEFRAELPDRQYGGKVARSQRDMDVIYAGVRSRFAERPDVRVHRARSVVAAKLFADGYFDWIYVDGSHTYEDVLADLAAFCEKVKPGGLIAGDDYSWGADEGYPVKRAVSEFVRHGDVETVAIQRGQFVLRRAHRVRRQPAVH